LAFNLQEFRANGIVDGYARPSLFQVTLAQDLTGSLPFDVTMLDRLRFVARGASLPGLNSGIIRVPYMGRTVPIAGEGRDYEDWVVTIFNNEDFALRELFESWSNAINSFESNIRNPAIANENYVLDFNVNQFAKTGEIIRSYKIIDAWPSRISAIDVDWEDANRAEVFQVSFSYAYWLPDEENAVDTAVPYLVDAIQPASV
jgi:hypothetical protein